MLQRLEISNFRSIHEAEVEFPATGVTVLVGPNGSGKSNLIKAVEFLSQIPSPGLQLAVARQGGRSSIVPKALPRRPKAKLHTKISALVQNSPEGSFPKGEPATRYKLDICWDSKFDYHVAREELDFLNPLSWSAHLAEEESRTERHPPERKAAQPSLHIAADAAEAHTSPPSHFSLRRSNSGALSYDSSPQISADNVGEFLRWIGFPKVQGAVSSGAQFRSFFQALSGPARQLAGEGVRNQSLLDSEFPAPIGMATQANVFRDWLVQARRFDLQLMELRREQLAAPARRFNATGRNLPSMVRLLRGDASQESWSRIVETMAEVAPHVSETSVSSLRGGKEFVEFIETQVGHAVESWNASDGTLRALAILVAVETQPEGTMLMIEPAVCTQRGARPSRLAH